MGLKSSLGILVVSLFLFSAPYALAFGGGNGSADTPYLVENCTDLSNMRNSLSSHYQLTADIDCAETSFSKINATFTGTLDGDGHTVSNLTISDASQYVGIFRLTQNATIENITFTDSSVTGNYMVGFFSGFDAMGTTFSKVAVINSTVRGASTAGGAGFVGGFIGAMWGTGTTTIVDSYINADVSAVAGRVGGFIGDVDAGGTNNVYITRSYSAGTVMAPNTVGGLVGLQYNVAAQKLFITDSFSVATLSASSTIGGLLGYVYNSPGNYITFSNSYFDAQGVSGRQCASSYNFSGCTAVNTDNSDQSHFKNTSAVEPLASWNFSSTWQTTTNYPSLRFTPADTTAPVISSVDSTPASSTVSVTWSTDEDSSSLVNYGLTVTYTSSTTEADTGTRVQSHSVSMANLVPCTTYHYNVYSADSSSNAATSSDKTFNTTGCVADESIQSSSIQSVTSSGATTTLATASSTLAVGLPSSFSATSSSVVIQINALDSDPVISSISKPSGYSTIGSTVYEVKALIDATTTLDSFDSPVMISFTYDSADIASIDESSLKVFHYHNNQWIELSNCSQNSSTMTVTCSTDSFSVFGLFGSSAASAGSGSSSNSSSSGSSTGSNGYYYACHDQKASNYEPVGLSRSSLCIYQNKTVQDNSTTTTSFDGKISEEISIKMAENKIVGFTEDLYRGVTSFEVLALQKYLNKNGFAVKTKGAGSEGQETTFFGPATKQALIRFQETNKIRPAAGYFGPITRNYINSR